MHENMVYNKNLFKHRHCQFHGHHHHTQQQTGKTNSSLQHKANVLCACAFIKRLCGYLIYDHAIHVVDQDVNHKEHEDESQQ
jgi:hypothetical protein